LSTKRFSPAGASLLSTQNKAKPPAAKGVYMQRITLSSTMGPGVRIDQSSIKLQ
jgi:large subunit ribosomal protein L1